MFEVIFSTSYLLMMSIIAVFSVFICLIATWLMKTFDHKEIVVDNAAIVQGGSLATGFACIFGVLITIIFPA